MLTAAAVLAAVLATSATPSVATDPADALPIASAAMVVNVTAAADIPRALVTATLHEADAIWRAAGFRFIWERNAALTTADSLHVVIGGGASPPTRNVPLAWIGFTEQGEPKPMIYVSHANAVAYMVNSRETVGLTDTMTVLQKETYLARAMGRALAHEIGHFLLGSPAHSRSGLMMASHSSTEFFYAERNGFVIPMGERRKMAARFTSIYLASRG